MELYTKTFRKNKNVPSWEQIKELHRLFSTDYIQCLE